MRDRLQLLKVYKQLNPNKLSEHQFKEIEHYIKCKKITAVDYVDFEMWCRKLPTRQELFAKYIEKQLARHPGAKILEVGSDRTGKLSILLKEKGFKMSCINPMLEVTSDNIEFIKSRFNYKDINLSKYDYVIAQEPCDATEYVVRACINQNVPFMITLDGEPHRLISGTKPKEANTWYKYMQSIASNEIKLYYKNMYSVVKTPILKSNKFR